MEEWLAGAIAALSAAQALPPTGSRRGWRCCWSCCATRRGLLVLDNLETVLEPGAPAVRYRAGTRATGRCCGGWESAHQGCLLLTGREQPLRADRWRRCGALRLGWGWGWRRAGRCWTRGWSGDEAAWRALVQRYAGNPLALSVVGETIATVFGGDIAAFLAQEVAVFGGIRQLLDEQVERLSALEQAMLAWLAVEREPVGFVSW